MKKTELELSPSTLETELELTPTTLEGEIIATENGWKDVVTGTIEKYKFKSLGCFDNEDSRKYKYIESTLFPKNSIVELTEGKFPIDSYLDLYADSKNYHTIGGKQVKLVAYCSSCCKDSFYQYDTPTIIVIE